MKLQLKASSLKPVFVTNPLNLVPALFLLRLKIVSSWSWSFVPGGLYLLTFSYMEEFKNKLPENLCNSLVIIHGSLVTTNFLIIAIFFLFEIGYCKWHQSPYCRSWFEGA